MERAALDPIALRSYHLQNGKYAQQQHQDPRAGRHLHGARAANQLEDLVNQDRHHEDVDEVPPTDGRATEEGREPGHVRD